MLQRPLFRQPFTREVRASLQSHVSFVSSQRFRWENPSEITLIVVLRVRWTTNWFTICKDILRINRLSYWWTQISLGFTVSRGLLDLLVQETCSVTGWVPNNRQVSGNSRRPFIDILSWSYSMPYCHTIVLYRYFAYIYIYISSMTAAMITNKLYLCVVNFLYL